MRILGILGLLAVLGTFGLQADNVIRLKTRDFRPPAGGVQTSPRCRHWLLRFAVRPDLRVLQELSHRRMRVLAFVPETALMVAAEGQPDLRGLAVTWAGPMNPADKISPLLADGTGDVYLVIFHPDVTAETMRQIAAQSGVQMLEVPGLAAEHLLISGARDRVLGLANQDDVAYIMPAAAELAMRKRVYRCPGPITAAGPVADYALAGASWAQEGSGAVALGYFFDSLTSKLDANAVRSALEQALSQWALYANVTFSAAQQAGAARSIDILFATGAHGDAYPFVDASVLAHTFYPAPANTEPVAGDIHFNDAESWGDGSGIDLFSVALHEAGHALGLGHSDDPAAVMYPYYSQHTGLTADDIAGIQALYGTRSSNTGSSSSPPAAPPVTPPVTPPGTPVTPSPSPSGSDTTPPSITITSPAATIVATSSATLTISGTASDNVGVTAVNWSTSTGSSGNATGTNDWSAAVPVLVGTNVVIVRAYDAAGNSGWRAITVVRQ